MYNTFFGKISTRRSPREGVGTSAAELFQLSEKIDYYILM